MTETKKFQITVLGETIRLNSDESVEHLNNVSAHIEELVRKVGKMGVSTNMSPAARLLFAMVLLTDEFLKTDAQCKRYAAIIDEAEKVHKNTKKEMEDFAFMFDKNKYSK